MRTYGNHVASVSGRQPHKNALHDVSLHIVMYNIEGINSHILYRVPLKATVCVFSLLLRARMKTMTRMQRVRSKTAQPATTPAVTPVELVGLEGALAGGM